jgi:hypothetical protein
MSLPELSATPRTALGRHRERGRADRDDLYAVLDAGIIEARRDVRRGHGCLLRARRGAAGAADTADTAFARSPAATST